MENSTDNYQDWSIPQRQSPAAIFIMLMQTIATLLKALWPFIILIFFRTRKPKDKDGEPLPVMAEIAIVTACIAALLWPFILTFLKYWYYKFHISNGSLIIQSGWLKKKTLSVPLQNIHAVHLEQSLWQRVLQVTKITIDSAGSEKAEAKIEALSLKNAEQLKAILLSQQHHVETVLKEETVSKTMQTRLTNADLFKFSLTSNHLEAFFILIGLSLNLIDNLKDTFNLDSWNLMESYAMQVAGQTTIVITILVVGVALISIVVSIIRTLIRFYNFEIEEVQQGWKISHGLITHSQKIIPSNKIQILSWKANWLRRKIDFWILNVQAVGHTSATTKPKQRLQIPVTSLNGVLSLAPVYQQSPVFNIDEGLKIEPDYWKRKTLMVGIPLTLIVGLLLYLWLGLGSISVVFLLAYLGWYFNKWYKVFRWQANDEGLQLYSGVWGRKFTLLTWKKVQQVQVNQSLYQRNHGLATVILYTAGGSVSLPYIQLQTATTLANLALFYVESREENWM